MDSCDVIKGHHKIFANSFKWKIGTTAQMVLLRSVHQGATNDMHFDLEVTLRSRDLMSTVDLDPRRSPYTYFDAYQRKDLDGIVSVALAWLAQGPNTRLYISATSLTYSPL